jgi:hypothetical protein
VKGKMATTAGRYGVRRRVAEAQCTDCRRARFRR